MSIGCPGRSQIGTEQAAPARPGHRSGFGLGRLVAAVVTVAAAVLPAAPSAAAADAPAATRPAGAVAAGPVTLRVLTYNLHHGATAKDVPSLEQQAKVIRDADPDLVALQELDKNTARTGKVDQLAKLAERTGLHPAFGRSMPFGGGEYGNGVLSRFPIESSATHALPSGPKEEPRCVVVTTVRVPAGGVPVTFAATHLNHRNAAERAAQAAAIVELLAAGGKGTDAKAGDAKAAEAKAEEGKPARGTGGLTVLAGDLNAEPDSSAVDVLRRAFRHASAGPDGDGSGPAGGKPAPTFPADKPRVTIDYVWVAPPARWRVKEVTVIDEPEASDHRPVLVVLEWTGERATDK